MAVKVTKRRGAMTVRAVLEGVTNPEGIEIRRNQKTIDAYVKRGYTIREGEPASPPSEAKTSSETKKAKG
jgi:hypothetical protein